MRDAQASGLRLISYDRPGQGMSAPQPGRVVADCAEDVRAILTQLGIPRAATWGGDPGRAWAQFQARSAEFARLSSSPTWWMDRWGDRAGQDAAHSQKWADYLALVNRDGYAGGDEGWWEDWSATFLPWGFDLAAIQAPVALWHGLHFPAAQDHTNVEQDNRSAAISWVRNWRV